MKRFPIRGWERHEHRKNIPRDLQNILGAGEPILRVGKHAWTNVQAPLPEAKVDSLGDALTGQGKHYSARIYFEQLDDWFTRWEYIGRAPAGKGKQSEDSWEIYMPLPDEEWLLVVVSKRADGEFYLKTVFAIRREKFLRRLEQGYLSERGRE